jgi:hypothetical protein
MLRAFSLFELFLLLYHVVQVIAIGIPEDWLDKGEHILIVARMPHHFTVLKPDQIVARLSLIGFTFKVIARARIYEVLDIADVVATSNIAVGVGSADDVVVLIEN